MNSKLLRNAFSIHLKQGRKPHACDAWNEEKITKRWKTVHFAINLSFHDKQHK